MTPSSRTPEGQPQQCPVCGNEVVIEPSRPPGDAPCPHCGCLIWFANAAGAERDVRLHSFSISDPLVQTKSQAIAIILDRLIRAGALEQQHRDEILAAILKREELGSTGIGRGIAIPHARFPHVTCCVGALAKFSPAVDFESLDRKPVEQVFLFISPADRPGDHLRVLEAVSRRLRAGG
jgi:mannitol/fructose-specific phosphotransferase system IIA component (Ntr-type)